MNVLICCTFGFLTWGLVSLIVPHETPISSTPTGSDTPYLIAFWPAFGLFLYLSFVILVKRLHDMNLPMWVPFVAAVVLLTPLNVLLALVLLFAPPRNNLTQNSNRYGVDPRYVEMERLYGGVKPNQRNQAGA
jgi:uncharacterized membrane protein YhaH (DUF805 family)